MAYEMKIRGTEHEVKVRNPWAVALLPIVTLGIYHLVWWYKINKELKAYGEAKGYDLGQNPTNSLLALFPGGLIIVPALVTYWRGTKRVQGASKIAGREPVSGWIALILYLLISPGDVGLPAGLAQQRLGAGGRTAAGPGSAAAAQRRDAAAHRRPGLGPEEVKDPLRVLLERRGVLPSHLVEVLDRHLAPAGPSARPLGRRPGRRGERCRSS